MAAVKIAKSAGGEQPAPVDRVELAAALWGFAQKVAGDHFERDDLSDGARHTVRLAIAAEVDGQRYSQQFDGDLTVGHASTRASSVGPDQDHLFAYILSKLNSATRNSICRGLVDDFAAAGELPAVGDDYIALAKDLRSALRQKVEQPVRGSVRVNHKPVERLGVVQ